MALRRKTAESGSGDDSDAPEAVSFGASKKTARGERDAVQRFHAEEKFKAKEKNRARDAALKARAASSKVQGKRKAAEEGRSAKRVRVEAEDDGSDDGEDGADSEGAAGGPSRQELEARMARAMMDAEDEEDEDRSDGHSALGELSDGEADTEDEDEMDEDADEDTDEGGEDDGTSDDEDMVSEEEEDQDDDDDDEAPRQKTNYLPDHLFKTALSNSTPKSSKVTFDNDTPSRIPPSKKPRRRKGPKDIVLGSRIIRTLSNPSLAAPSVATRTMKRPARVEKFVKKSLNVKGDATKSKSKGWTRRPANLGIMKRNGPAANFVRDA